jgi:hypothetical protein
MRCARQRLLRRSLGASGRCSTATHPQCSRLAARVRACSPAVSCAALHAQAANALEVASTMIRIRGLAEAHAELRLVNPRDNKALILWCACMRAAQF